MKFPYNRVDVPKSSLKGRMKLFYFQFKSIFLVFFKLSEVAEGQPSEDTCDRLLALERDLDNTMLRSESVTELDFCIVCINVDFKIRIG